MIGTNLLNYQIQAKLGEGGQGAAYKALDTKLGRTVVVKVLPTNLTADKNNLKRFQREAKLASSLDHPNICTIFEMNEANGLNFIVMQYIEGQTVRDLVHGKPLELQGALSITIQVIDALSAAHSRGIVHRDIKAQNVMVTDSGRAKVLDFGLAKLMDEEAAASAGIHNTEVGNSGTPYGTATYAAPEQTRGENADERADVFSTGVLLYEMLTGTWPFRGKNAIETRIAVLNSDPKLVSEHRKDPIPDLLQQSINKALAKNPADRYQKISAFGVDLRRVLREISDGNTHVSFTESVPPRHAQSQGKVSRAVRWLKNIRGSSGATTPNTSPSMSPRSSSDSGSMTTTDRIAEKKSIAIMPFRNLKNDPDSQFYEFALADAVITELATLRSLVVRPSSVIAKFQGKEIEARDVGRELQVNAILTAGFISAGNHFRVTTQLLDVGSDNILWSDRIDADTGDIFGLQDTIAKRIVEGLRLELTPDEKGRIERVTKCEPAAYQEFLRGRDFFLRYIFRTLARDDCDSAIDHFKKSISIDPNFAPAHSGLGACYANRVFKGLSGAEDYERAEIAFNRAIELDPEIAEARMLKVFVLLWRGQKEKARAEVALMKKQAPNEAVVYFVKAILDRSDGCYEDSLRSLDRLVELDPPVKAVAEYHRTLIAIYQGRVEEAKNELAKLVATEPDNPMVLTALTLAHYYLKEIPMAMALIKQVLEHDPTLHGARAIAAICLAAKGKKDAAHAQLTYEVMRNAEADYDISYWVGSVYALLNEREKAFDWLQRSIALGNENREWFEKDPNWSAFHEDSRFKQILERITC